MSRATERFPSPNILGILNITDDSFSDGGLFLDPAAAIAHARELFAQGASIIDVGGESTRPGASRIPVEEEQRRVLPVIKELVSEHIPVSLDTMNADTAKKGIELGVTIINDISAGKADPDMLSTVSDAGCFYIAMHWRGHSSDMDSLVQYDDVVDDVIREISSDVDRILAAGINQEKIILDPGFGFSKTLNQNWQIFRHIDSFLALGFPVLIGISRKRFLSQIADIPSSVSYTSAHACISCAATHKTSLGKDALGDTACVDNEITLRDFPSGILAAIAVIRGVWGVRMHNVALTRTALNTFRHAGLHVTRAHCRTQQSPASCESTLDVRTPPETFTSKFSATKNSSNSTSTHINVPPGDHTFIEGPTTSLSLSSATAPSPDSPSEQTNHPPHTPRPPKAPATETATNPPSASHLPVIRIRNLRLHANHGVYPVEREYGQQFVIDADVKLRHHPEDRIESTIDYDTLTDRFIKCTTKSPVNLIETLADRLVRIAVLHPLADAATVTVTKPDPPLTHLPDKSHAHRGVLTGVQLSCTVQKIRDNTVIRVYIGIGSNIGNRLDNINAAISILANHPMISIVSLGKVFRSTAIVGSTPDSSLPEFLNTAIAVDTSLPPRGLLDFMLYAEKKLGRVRPATPIGTKPIRRNFTNRSIDLDILCAEKIEINDPDLHIPHPRLDQRAFVLLPLQSIDPDLYITRLGSIANLISNLPQDQLNSVTRCDAQLNQPTPYSSQDTPSWDVTPHDPPNNIISNNYTTTLQNPNT